jgi:hypothetical protein
VLPDSLFFTTASIVVGVDPALDREGVARLNRADGAQDDRHALGFGFGGEGWHRPLLALRGLQGNPSQPGL